MLILHEHLGWDFAFLVLAGCPRFPTPQISRFSLHLIQRAQARHLGRRRRRRRFTVRFQRVVRRFECGQFVLAGRVRTGQCDVCGGQLRLCGGGAMMCVN